MEGLYKLDSIEGKGFGWIALQDIKPGQRQQQDFWKNENPDSKFFKIKNSQF